MGKDTLFIVAYGLEDYGEYGYMTFEEAEEELIHAGYYLDGDEGMAVRYKNDGGETARVLEVNKWNRLH